MLDTKALIALGARAEIERLACQLGDLIQTFPELSTVAEDTIAATIAHATERRKPRPPQPPHDGAPAIAGILARQSTPKRTMSKATRAKMAANMRRRWAAAKKAGKTLGAPAKPKAHRKQQETPTP